METPTTDELIAALKSGEYDGTIIMQAWCRLRDLAAESEERKSCMEYIRKMDNKMMPDWQFREYVGRSLDAAEQRISNPIGAGIEGRSQWIDHRS